MSWEQVHDAVGALAPPGGANGGEEPATRAAVLAMVSGGRDSTCLLGVLVEQLGSERVCALHVNYGLRASADGDERHCAALCEQLQVELLAERAGPPEGGNLQAWARELRYARARRIAAERRCPIATGHTASDQLETIIYRLAASPGRRALLGMGAAEDGLVRPLLTLTREQTAAYCRERGLRWRDDESNEDERFARVRVRTRVLPALLAVHPAAAANVLRTAELLREETELLDGLVERELEGRAAISLERLRELEPALARMVLVRLAEDATGNYVPQAGERVQEILALGGRGGRAELHLGGRAGAVLEHGSVRMVKLPPRL